MNKTKIDEDTTEIFIELKKAFKAVESQTRQAIRELIAETDPELKKTARLEYLKGCMTEKITEAMELMSRYEDYQRRDCTLEKLLTGEKIQAKVKEIQKIQGEAIALRKGNNSRADITEDMIQRAKSYPFTDLIEIQHNTARCFLHEDKKPSMHYYPASNTLHCFSCHKTLDTIDYVMERDGLSFKDAVRGLQ